MTGSSGHRKAVLGASSREASAQSCVSEVRRKSVLMSTVRYVEKEGNSILLVMIRLSPLRRRRWVDLLRRLVDLSCVSWRVDAVEEDGDLRQSLDRRSSEHLHAPSVKARDGPAWCSIGRRPSAQSPLLRCGGGLMPRTIGTSVVSLPSVPTLNKTPRVDFLEGWLWPNPCPYPP